MGRAGRWPVWLQHPDSQVRLPPCKGFQNAMQGFSKRHVQKHVTCPCNPPMQIMMIQVHATAPCEPTCDRSMQSIHATNPVASPMQQDCAKV
eukprot:366345-Chlamydomonas_euryale.AAC.5